MLWGKYYCHSIPPDESEVLSKAAMLIYLSELSQTHGSDFILGGHTCNVCHIHHFSSCTNKLSQSLVRPAT